MVKPKGIRTPQGKADFKSEAGNVQDEPGMSCLIWQQEAIRQSLLGFYQKDSGANMKKFSWIKDRVICASIRKTNTIRWNTPNIFKSKLGDKTVHGHSLVDEKEPIHYFEI